MVEHAPEPAPGSRSRGRVTSGAFAMALVIAAVGVWWLLSGNGPQGPGGNDPRYAVPDVDVSAPTDAPTSGPAAGEPTSSDPAVPGGVRIDSYVVLDDLRLTLSYEVARCVPELGSPRVIETDASVTITLVADDGCVERGDAAGGGLERRTVPVLIDSPLDGRAVLDGSTSPLVRVEATDSANAGTG